MAAGARRPRLRASAGAQTFFYLLPDWPRNRVLELAPAYWKQTLEQEEAQRRLAENPLRRALLAFVR